MAVSGFRLRARLGFSIPSSHFGQRGITPAFGYGAPHLSAGGTSTLPIWALPSAHYDEVRLLVSVHHRLRLLAFPMRTGGCCRTVDRETSRFPHKERPHMPGSLTTPDRPGARDGASGRVAFRNIATASAPGIGNFRGSMAGLCVPLSTLRRGPREHLRMTRGRCGSLLLHRKGLAPSTPCRSPGARKCLPVLASDSGHERAMPALRIVPARTDAPMSFSVSSGVLQRPPAWCSSMSVAI